MRAQQKYKTQISWLLDGDPAVRLQTIRDLLDAGEAEILVEQKKILTNGWGKQLFDFQDKNGTWSNALYSPKWTSTFYSMLLLKRFGAPANERLQKSCMILLDKGFYEKDGGINYWKSWKFGECCVTGMLLSVLCHFNIDDERLERMVNYLITEQMPDLGWNCEKPRGATHSSFHTTLSVLEGLWEFEQKHPESPQIAHVREKQTEGIEFILQHHLYKSNTTWEPVNTRITKLAFPPRWYFDILRCLDLFQDKNIEKDERMNDAIGLLKKKQTPDGFWKLEHKYPNKVFFDMEQVGKPSRWNTLRALRVLKWWDA